VGKCRVSGGYVDVPRSLYDALLAAPFTLAQLKVALVIVRFTWGYYPEQNRDGARIKHQAVADYSGLSLSTVQNVVPALVKAGVIDVVSPNAGRTPAVLRLNPHPHLWGRFAPPQKPGSESLDPPDAGGLDESDGHPARHPLAQVDDTPPAEGVATRPAGGSTGSHVLPSLVLPSLVLPSIDEEQENAEPRAPNYAAVGDGRLRRVLEQYSERFALPSPQEEP